MGDFLEPIRTWNPSRVGGDDFMYVDVSAVDSATKRIARPVRVGAAEAPSRARRLIRTGDVLVSTVRPNLNAIAVVPPTLDGATASTGFAVLRPSSELDERYLFHWVRTPAFVSDMVKKSLTGTSLNRRWRWSGLDFRPHADRAAAIAARLLPRESSA